MAMLGQQLDQLPEPGQVVPDPPADQHPTVGIDDATSWWPPTVKFRTYAHAAPFHDDRPTPGVKSLRGALMDSARSATPH